MVNIQAYSAPAAPNAPNQAKIQETDLYRRSNAGEDIVQSGQQYAADQENQANALAAAQARIDVRADILETSRTKGLFSQVANESRALATTIDPREKNAQQDVMDVATTKLNDILSKSTISDVGRAGMVRDLGTMMRGLGDDVSTGLNNRAGAMLLVEGDNSTDAGLNRIADNPDTMNSEIAQVGFDLSNLSQAGKKPEFQVKMKEFVSQAFTTAFDAYKVSGRTGAMMALTRRRDFRQMVPAQQRLAMELDIQKTIKATGKGLTGFDAQVAAVEYMTDTKIPLPRRQMMKELHSKSSDSDTYFAGLQGANTTNNSDITLQNLKLAYGPKGSSSVVGAEAGVESGLEAIAEYKTLNKISKDTALTKVQMKQLTDSAFKVSKGGTTGSEAGDELAEKFIGAVRRVRGLAEGADITPADMDLVTGKIFGYKPGEKDKKDVMAVLKKMYPKASATELNVLEADLDEETRAEMVHIDLRNLKIQKTTEDHNKSRFATAVGGAVGDPRFEAFYDSIPEERRTKLTFGSAQELYKLHNGADMPSSLRNEMLLTHGGDPDNEKKTVMAARTRLDEIAVLAAQRQLNPSEQREANNLLVTAYPIKLSEDNEFNTQFRQPFSQGHKSLIDNHGLINAPQLVSTLGVTKGTDDEFDGSFGVTPNDMTGGLYANADGVVGATAVLKNFAAHRPGGQFQSAERLQQSIKHQRDFVQSDLRKISQGISASRLLAAEYNEFAVMSEKLDTRVFSNKDAYRSAVRAWDDRAIDIMESLTKVANKRASSSRHQSEANAMIETVKRVRKFLGVPPLFDTDKALEEAMPNLEYGDIIELPNASGKGTMILEWSPEAEASLEGPQ